MKFVCLGYFDEKEFEKWPEADRNKLFDESFAYDDVLRSQGHWGGGPALQSPNTAKTLRLKHGKVAVTDGPYAETKEQIGGILELEARDMNHAVELMSKHPATKITTFEIRPVADLEALQKESEKRRKTGR
jgi:hypothetical protein